MREDTVRQREEQAVARKLSLDDEAMEIYLKRQGLQGRTKFIQRWEDSVIAQGAIGIVQRADAEAGIEAERTKLREWRLNLEDVAGALAELIDGARSMWTKAKSLLDQVKGYALNVDQEKYMERQERQLAAENRKADVDLAEIRRHLTPPDNEEQAEEGPELPGA